MLFYREPHTRTEHEEMEPDLLQNSHVNHNNFEDTDFGPRFKKLRITDNVRELQTVLRDK